MKTKTKFTLLNSFQQTLLLHGKTYNKMYITFSYDRPYDKIKPKQNLTFVLRQVLGVYSGPFFDQFQLKMIVVFEQSQHFLLLAELRDYLNNQGQTNVLIEQCQ